AGSNRSYFLSRTVLEHEGCQSYLRAPSHKLLYLHNLSNTIPAFGEKHREKGIQTEENLYGAGLRKALDARVGNNRQAEVQGSQEPTHLVLPLYLSSSFALTISGSPEPKITSASSNRIKVASSGSCRQKPYLACLRRR